MNVCKHSKRRNPNSLQSLTFTHHTDFPRILAQIWVPHGNHRQSLEKQSSEKVYGLYHHFMYLVCDQLLFSTIMSVASMMVLCTQNWLSYATTAGNRIILGHNVFYCLGFIAYDTFPAYVASKHGIVGFVRALGVSMWQGCIFLYCCLDCPSCLVHLNNLAVVVAFLSGVNGC